MSRTGILWFRQDLRLSDNPALCQAAEQFDKLICVFIDDPLEQTCSRIGAASRAWLHRSLQSLDQTLQKHGNRLVYMQGPALDCLLQLQQSTDATGVFWNRCYDPVSIERDKHIKAELGQYFSDCSDAPAVQSFNSLLLVEPWENRKDDGTAYRVFTPYWRRLAPSLPGAEPQPVPGKIPPNSVSAKKLAGTVSLDALGLLPAINWHDAMLSYWSVGESAAQKRLSDYVKQDVNDYAEARNLPAIAGTSRLSPYLHFGEISPRQIIHALYRDCADVTTQKTSAETYAKEIGWREFAYHLLFHFPQMIEQPLDNRFANFPWAENTQTLLSAWQKGQTGVPIVDAGMRELWQTGWMHNRVRMIAASYLVKNLLIPWQAGEQWFRDTLVDADIASNVMGWQWTAGSGADAAPYFRVFNPVLQGEKFDKEGEYVKRWVPELQGLEKKMIHKPWELPMLLRSELDYPDPLVNLGESRVRALAAFDKIKAGSRSA